MNNRETNMATEAPPQKAETRFPKSYVNAWWTSCDTPTSAARANKAFCVKDVALKPVEWPIGTLYREAQR